MQIRRNLQIILSTAFLIVVYAFSAAHAGIVFGPEKFSRTSGKPDVFTANFNASEGKGDIRILNGDPDGGGRATSAYITINDRMVLKPGDFKNSDYTIEKEVELASDNKLEIELRSAPDSFLILEIEQEGLFVSIECTSETIYAGQQAELIWTSSHAEQVVIDNGIGDVDLNGSQTVAPETTTTYTITATGAEGSASDHVTLNVLDPPTPEVSLEASKADILSGESVTLSWTSQHVDQCMLSPDIGEVDLTGSLTVTPAQTTTFFLSGSGLGGTAVDEVTVNVSHPQPELTFSASATEISYGQALVLSWTSKYTESCEISPQVGPVALSGSQSVTPTTTTTYVLTATGPGGQTSRSITISVLDPPPSVTLTVSPSTITAGESAVLFWSVENATSVSIDPAIGDVEITGDYTVSPDTTTTYALTATGPGGTTTDSVTLSVEPPPQPTVSISATPESIIEGESSTLSWNSTDATEAVIGPDIGQVQVNGSVPVFPAETTTYTISVTGPGGAATDSVTISLAPPTASISADPVFIKHGGTATLTWSTEHADTCTISPDIGGVPQNGSIGVSPTQTTTYTLAVAGPGGTTTDTVTITVQQPPKVSLSISPSTITYGESATLTWDAAPAQKAFLNQGIGEVPPSGSMTITPEYTTSYAFTAVNDGLTAHYDVSVKVIGSPPPEPQPEGSFGNQYNDLVPEDASLASYNPERFVVVTGLVNDINGNPLPEVTVSVADHPEYGTARTDETGRFSIPAEGGGLMVISYEKPDYIPAHRKADAPVADVVTMETATLITRDPASTLVNFNGNPETVIAHQSTEVTDAFGTRSATMVFTGDNRAYELDRYGNRVRELRSITARATEFTTPESMPAKLPPTTAYTYCAELEADGVERIEFDKPVTVYVDNFLGFEVGGIVPVGYYDRDRAEWVPSENGTVVQLLDTNSDGTVDSLDSNGDGQADDLDGDGSFLDEVSGVNISSYAPGETYWRFALDHFTPTDCNWPFGPTEGAIVPNAEGTPTPDLLADAKGICITKSGSHVNDRSRILNQDIPVPGTGLTLHYASHRVDGYNTVINVPASGDELPPLLKRIVVEVKVAGRVLKETLNPLPNQKAQMVWDGLDYLGRAVEHTVTAKVGVGFVYDAVYRNPISGFGEPGIGWTGSDARMEVTLWQRNDITVFPPQSVTKGESIPGWTLSAHHSIDPLSSSVLQKGDGTSVRNSDLNLINTLAALDSSVNCLDTDEAGNIFAGTYTRIYKITSDAQISVFAGTGQSGYSGDGGPAVEARFNMISGLAFAETGELYVADTNNHRIRKIDRNGVITTVAGTGTAEFSGDGGPAQGAALKSPGDIEFDPSGNLYISDKGNGRVRKISPSGLISTYAGGGDLRTFGIPATEYRIRYLEDLGVDPDGNVYFVDSSDNTCGWVLWEKVVKIDSAGIVSRFAGSGCSSPRGSGYPATDVALGQVTGLEFDPEGNAYIAHFYEYDVNYNWGDYDCLIRKVNTDGLQTIFAGNKTDIRRNNSGIGYDGDGGPATQALLNTPLDLAAGGSGKLFVADTVNRAIRTVGPPSIFSRATTGGEIVFAEEDLGYLLDSTGRHQETIDLETGRTLYTFSYQAFEGQEYLTAITDQFGNRTMINRHADGTPYAIVSPDGLTTSLSVDMENHLTRITLADGSVYDFAYTQGGLLTQKTTPNADIYQYAYDENGRITDTYDDNGGHWQFARQADPDGTIYNTVTTGENNLTTYEDKTASTGGYTSAIIGPAGGETLYTRSADGLTVQKDLSCGMRLNFQYDLDPEYRYKYIKESTETTPSGLTRTTLKDVVYEDTDADTAPDRVTRSLTVNDRLTTLENDVLYSTKTIISPENRTVTSTYDPDTLVTTSTQIPGLNPTDYAYYADGRLRSVVTGTRETSYTYDFNGYLASVTDPKNRTTFFANDRAGRVTRIDRPDGTTLGFVYDANGNMTVLSNPSNIDHEFAYNAVDKPISYTPPISGSYSYFYDRDRRLVQKTFPSGKRIFLGGNSGDTILISLG